MLANFVSSAIIETDRAAAGRAPRRCSSIRRPTAQDTLKLGLVAAMSGQSAKSGEAIVRGLSLAIDEINAKGGLLGKKVELLVRDDESNPAKGVVAARELVQREKVAALFGGLDTPVSHCDRAVRQRRQGAVHGGLGGRHADHAQRRGGELRVPRLRGRRASSTSRWSTTR